MPVNVAFKEPETHRFEFLFFLYVLMMLIGIAIINLPRFIIYEIKHRKKEAKRPKIKTPSREGTISREEIRRAIREVEKGS